MLTASLYKFVWALTIDIKLLKCNKYILLTDLHTVLQRDKIYRVLWKLLNFFFFGKFNQS